MTWFGRQRFVKEWVEDKHPRHPAGTADGKGGEFAPAGGPNPEARSKTPKPWDPRTRGKPDEQLLTADAAESLVIPMSAYLRATNNADSFYRTKDIVDAVEKTIDPEIYGALLASLPDPFDPRPGPDNGSSTLSFITGLVEMSPTSNVGIAVHEWGHSLDFHMFARTHGYPANDFRAENSWSFTKAEEVAKDYFDADAAGMFSSPMHRKCFRDYQDLWTQDVEAIRRAGDTLKVPPGTSPEDEAALWSAARARVAISQIKGYAEEVGMDWPTLFNRAVLKDDAYRFGLDTIGKGLRMLAAAKRLGLPLPIDAIRDITAGAEQIARKRDYATSPRTLLFEQGCALDFLKALSDNRQGEGHSDDYFSARKSTAARYHDRPLTGVSSQGDSRSRVVGPYQTAEMFAQYVTLRAFPRSLYLPILRGAAPRTTAAFDKIIDDAREHYRNTHPKHT